MTLQGGDQNLLEAGETRGAWIPPDHLPRGIPKRHFISWVRADTKLFLGTSVSFSLQARRMLFVPQTLFYSLYFLLFLTLFGCINP